MIIFLMRTDSDLAELYLYHDARQLDRVTWEAKRHLAETIHLTTQQILERNQLSWPDIEALVVYSGPGSFTGLRIGHSVANALADSLSVPIVGVNGIDWIKQGIRRIMQGQNDKIALPDYGAQPKTTSPSK